MSASNQVRNVVLVGHKGSGKTSLAEAILFVAKATPKLGKVDDKSSILDDAAEEKDHACTLEASVAHAFWGDTKINLIDTPGEGSFLAETRLAMAAVDAAILVVSAKDGVQPITERVYAWAKELELPVVCVVTKVDAENASPDDAIAEIRQRLKAPVAVMETPLGVGLDYKGIVALRTRKAWVEKAESPTAIKPDEIPADAASVVDDARAKLVDDVAGTDDELTEKYLTEGDLTQAELDKGLADAMSRRAVVPLYFASGVRPSGVVALLDGIVELVPGPGRHGPFRGMIPAGKDAGPKPGERPPATDAPTSVYVFKTSVDQHAGRMSFARVISGSIKHDTSYYNPNIEQQEKVGKLFHAWPGKDAKALDEAHAGDIVGLGKLKQTLTGHTLCDEKQPFRFEPPELPPALFSRGVKFEGKGSEEKVGTALHRLREEDPALQVAIDESTRELVVSGLGALHLELTVERIRRRIGVECRLGPPHIAYKETISKKVTGVEGKHKKQSGGHGQFGVCYIDLEPLPRGGGFVFADEIVGGSIPRQFIPSVEKGIVKAMERGVLAGFPMVDVKVRLYDGKYHDVDSSDAAFQVAGRKAFKEACSKAGMVLLEPVVKLQVTVPSENMGDVIGDINSRRGRVTGTDTLEQSTLVNAFVPLSEILEYESKLKSMTQGKGTFTMTIDHLEVCPPIVQEKVVKDAGFTAESDDE